MVLPVAGVAVTALIRLIAWLSSIVFVSGYVRDIVTKSKEEDIQASQDQTVQNILDNPDLSPSEKTKVIQEYLNLGTGENWADMLMKNLPLLVIGIIIIVMMGGRR